MSKVGRSVLAARPLQSPPRACRPVAPSQVRQDVNNSLTRLASTDYTGATLLQLKKQALIIDLIHYVDVTDQLIK